MELQPVILESQNAMNAADGATTERRTRINRPDEGRGRCKGSRASGRRKDFFQCMQQSTTPSTSNVILHRQERTEPFGPRRCRHGTKSSPRREPDVPAEFLRVLFGNVTKPSAVQRKIARKNVAKSVSCMTPPGNLLRLAGNCAPHAVGVIAVLHVVRR